MQGLIGINEDWVGANLPGLTDIHYLSRGGQKQVFSARHSDDGAVVIKIMHANSEIERIERELIAVRRINSGRVPLIFDGGRIASSFGALFWFREQLVPGSTVRDLLSSGPLGPLPLLRLALHVSEALVAAEAAHIVHRDVKPENIIQDINGDFWLIDFGIARHLDLDSLTATVSFFGNMTFGYAPIEQFRNFKRAIDSRADLFALGVTLHECATGSNFFRHGAGDYLEIIRRLEKNTLPRVLLPISSDIDFADLVACLTQREKVHRPQTALEAHEWIRDICSREAVA